MQKINFQDLPNTTTPINASNLNQVQTNTENAINVLNTYSTSEQTIGTWIDDKPLYRKVFQIPTISSSPYSINISTLNIDEVISINGSYTTGTGNEKDKIPLSTWFSSTYNIATTIKIGTGNISVAWGGWSSITSGIIILEYTKTTD